MSRTVSVDPFSHSSRSVSAATVIASVDGKEVARTESRIAVRDPAALAPADPSSVPITPPVISDDKVVKKLPEVFSEVVPGGGGRYLIFHMPKLKKLAVFDVNEARRIAARDHVLKQWRDIDQRRGVADRVVLVLVVTLICADRVVAGPLAVVEALAERERPIVQGRTDGHRGI